MEVNEYTGKKFGHLTALEPTDKVSKTEGRIWRWQCDCSEKTIVELPIQRVKQGRTKSCGCLSRNGAVDITGMRFGRLTAIRPTEERYRKEVVWEFKCDCENIVRRPQSLVSGGKCKSCGCLGEETQKKLYETKYKRNHVLGTSLTAISASESQMSKQNKSGVKGVYFDSSKNRFMAYLGFQGEKYRIPCNSFEDAVATRKRMKELHYDFIEWWYGLSEPEKQEWILQYHTEKKAQAEAFREMINQWRDGFPLFFG